MILEINLVNSHTSAAATYLSFFTYTHKKLWCFDKSNGKKQEKSPESKCFTTKDFYDDYIEKDFNTKFEFWWNPLIKKIIKGCQNNILELEEEEKQAKKPEQPVTTPPTNNPLPSNLNMETALNEFKEKVTEPPIVNNNEVTVNPNIDKIVDSTSKDDTTDDQFFDDFFFDE